LRLRGAAALAVALCLSLGAAAALAAGSSLQPTGEPGKPVIIRWSTESEVNTAGYNLYRAAAEAGPWQKLNPRLIPGSPDPLRGGSYVFTDTNVIAGLTYWYELEEVELSGQATRLQRTQAVAQPQRGSPLGALPCGAALLPAVALGAVIAARRRG
jgi:hypothetical protein